MALTLKELMAAQERLREKETAPEKITVAQLSEIASKESAAKPSPTVASDAGAKILSELKKHTELFTKAFLSPKKGDKGSGSQGLESELRKHTSLLTDLQQQLKKDHSYQIWGELKKHTKIFEEGVTITGAVESKDTMTYEDVIENKRLQEEQLKLLQKLTEKKEEDQKTAEKQKSTERGIGGILTALAVSLGTVVGYIKGYVKILKSITEAITPDELIKSIKNGFTKVKDFFGNVGKFIAEQFDKVKKMFSFGDEGSKIGKALESIKSTVSNFFEPIKDGLKMIEEGSDFVKKGVTWIDGIVDTIKGFFGGVSKFSGSFVKVFKGTMKVFEKLALPLTVIMAIWDSVKGAIEGFEKEGVVGAIKGAITGLVDSLVTGPLDMLKSAVSWIVGAFGFEEAEKFLDSFSFSDLFKQYIDAIFSPVDTLKKMFDGAVDIIKNISIPEISFTIPIIDKKVSIGPFYPFGKSEEKSATAAPAAPAAQTPTPRSKENLIQHPKPRAAAQEVFKKTDFSEKNAETQPTASRLTGKQERELFNKDSALYDKFKNFEEDIIDAEMTKFRQDASYTTMSEEDRQKRFEAIKQNAATQASSKFGKELEGAGVLQPSAAIQAPPPMEANAVYQRSAQNAEVGTSHASQPIVVSAPTNVNSTSNQNIAMSAPIRNTDIGLGSYVKQSAMFV